MAPDLTPAQDKTLANLRAAFSLRGHEVHTLSDGSFLIARWGMTKVCPSLQHLRAAARQMLGVVE